jgi:hypothetical protein
VKFFVDVTDASVQASQICSVDTSWFARSKATTESADGAVALGSPFLKHQNSLFNFMKLNVELRGHGVNRQDVAATPGQFVKFMSRLCNFAESFPEVLDDRRWSVSKVVFDDGVSTFGLTLDIMRMVIDVFVEASLGGCSMQSDCKSENQSVSDFCSCSFHIRIPSSFG